MSSTAMRSRRRPHGSFTLVVISAYDGFGRETERFPSILIVKVSEKRDIPVSFKLRLHQALVHTGESASDLYTWLKEALANAFGHHDQRSRGCAVCRDNQREMNEEEDEDQWI